MFTALVKGSVTSLTKHRSLRGVRLLIVQPVEPLADRSDPPGAPPRMTGPPQIAVDVLGAAIGARVVVSGDGRGVQDMLAVGPDCPVRLAIVALLDTAPE